MCINYNCIIIQLNIHLPYCNKIQKITTMEISEIKQRLTLSQLLGYYHLKPDKNLRLHCPFHEDKTPSLQVYYKTHTAYCFSSHCKTHGRSLDVIEFIMHKENCTKHEAILKAKEIISYYEGKIQHQQKPITITPAATLSIGKEIFLQNMFTYFKNAVSNSKPARDYLQSRGLNPIQLEVGYNTAQFHHGARRDENLINNSVAVGLLAAWGTNNRKPEEQAYKAFGKECIVFAMKNQENQITGLYFRSTINNDTQKHYYLKESTGLYPSYPKKETEKLIITESIIDAASILQIERITKEYTVLAAYGTNRLNEEMQAAIKELPKLNEIVFAFDSDEAGKQATLKYANLLREQLQEQQPNIIFTTLTLPNKDVNETLTAHNEEIFAHLLAQRTNINTAITTPTSNPNIFLSTEKKNETENTIENKNEEPPTEPPTETNNTAAQLYIDKPPTPIAKGHPAKNHLNTSNPYKLIFTTAIATYLIKGGVDNVLTKLQITLEIENPQLQEGINKRRFKIDLYDSKQTEKLAQETSEYLQLIKTEVETDLHHITEALDQYREQAQQQEQTTAPEKYIMTQQEKNEALQIAKDKDLVTTIQNKLTQTGIIGEEANKTFLFVVAASHIQENPLNALVQGSSGSGKTNLLKSIFKIIPEENKKIYSRCSEKMLYNVPKNYFKNKLVCFEDVDGLGEEAEYAWRELVSNAQLISGVSYKDEKGNIGIKEHEVYGPITSIACTTKGAIYADNMSRLFLIAIDESKEQTQKINAYQAREAAGEINKQTQAQAIRTLQNYTRILLPYQVHNPHATNLKLPEGIRDERRLYRLYLYFIDMITVLHQYQRKKTEQGKLIATKADCQIAKDLMFECIMLKMDELDGSLRQFFERLKEYVKAKNVEKYSFTQREIRTALNISKTHLFRFMQELVQLEYIQEHKYNGNQGNSYQIRYWDDYKKVREEVKQFLQEQIDKLSAL
jgi:DNA primase